jgi:anti-sigma-K factor RskA
MECLDCQELMSGHALDALDEAERRALESHVAGCPACAAELAAMREVVASLGYGAPAAPLRADLKGRLFERVRAGEATAVRPAAPAPVAVARAAWGWKVASVLLGVGLLASLARQGQVQGELDAVRAKNGELLAQVAVAQERLASLGASDVRVVSLVGQPGAPGGEARLFWSAERNAWILAIAELPPAGAGKTYQLWAVTADDKLSMGTFEPNARGAAVVETRLERPGRPVAAAVSLEPAGGVPQPTGPIVLLGNL